MAKGKNKFMEKLTLNFMEENGNEFQIFLYSSFSVRRIKDIHSRFLNVDCENFHYFYGNIDLASAVVNELSLKDLHIKNNAMTSLKFVTSVQTSL